MCKICGGECCVLSVSEERGELFSQKEFIGMIMGLKDDINVLTVKMSETNGNIAVTNINIAKYNGLLEKFDDCEAVNSMRFEKIEAEVAVVKQMHLQCQAERQTEEKVEDRHQVVLDHKKNLFRLDTGNIVQILIMAIAIIALWT